MNDKPLNGFLEPTQTPVIDYSQCRLGELVEFALEQELVESCHVARHHVVVSFCGRDLNFEPDQARDFLSSLLHGWDRTQAPAPRPQPPVQDLRRRSLFTAPAATISGASLAAAIPGGGFPPPGNTSDEAYMDAVLACAEKLRLIEGYNKDRTAHRITLRTKATTADMSYFETLQYLTESILEELRPASRV